MGSASSPSRYARGSEWRRWDLHVHTPYSVLNNGFGSDFEEYAKALFERAIEKEIAVIGVTDYFTVRGYRELRELQQDASRLTGLLGQDSAEAASQILLLANVELRLGDLVKAGSDGGRINLHVIFAEDLPAEVIERDFLHALEFPADSAPGAPDDNRRLTEENLRAFGERLKADHAPFRGEDDLVIGMTQAVVSHEDVTRLLGRGPFFPKRHLIVPAADEDLSRISWDGQGHMTRKRLIQKADMLFSANPNTRSFGLGERHENPEAFEDEFKSLKPCIHGSDAHSIEELFVCDQDRQLWVRADPTFNGLSQLLLSPRERVYIGPEPPSIGRVGEAATKIIDSVGFERVGQADPDQRWFSGSTPLNPGLVAVIGKKGSGKSALAEATALAGNARNRDLFSFLKRDRFLSPRGRLGAHFAVDLVWCSGESTRMLLGDATDESLPARVKYIPQHYLERVCTEITDSSVRSLFDTELEAVIFSHVPVADRLGKESLRELVEHRTASVAARIDQLRGRLGEANRRYFELTRRGSAENRRTLTTQLAERQAELEAHERARPAEPPKPSGDDESDPEATAAAEELAGVVKRIEGLDGQIEDLRRRNEEAKKRQAAIKRVFGGIENLRSTVSKFIDDGAGDFELLGFDGAEIVSLQVEAEELEKTQIETEQEIEQLADALDESHSASPRRLRAEASEKADQLRRRLDEPQRRYQEYQRALAQWQRRGAEIRGSTEKPDTVAGLEAKLAALDEIPDEIAAAEALRGDVTAQIFAAKEELLQEFRRLYDPVQDFINNHPVAQEVTALSFSAENAIDGFVDGLLAMIHQGRRGSFQGEQDGRELLRELIAKYDFSKAPEVTAFLSELTDALTHDIRQTDRPAVGLDDQLVGSSSPEDLFDFVFGLEYLRPRFELRWREKPLHQLSPGERGTLLLVFYLLIDTDGAPLLIDQPEENLDNETVTQLLVPAVRHAKQRRQIIMVTHNPNLAVVCDADQVVHAEIDKVKGNRITYTAGSIENPQINQLIVDVLEGTKPAFDLRDAKYEVLDRVVA